MSLRRTNYCGCLTTRTMYPFWWPTTWSCLDGMHAFRSKKKKNCAGCFGIRRTGEANSPYLSHQEERRTTTTSNGYFSEDSERAPLSNTQLSHETILEVCPRQINSRTREHEKSRSQVTTWLLFSSQLSNMKDSQSTLLIATPKSSSKVFF